MARRSLSKAVEPPILVDPKALSPEWLSDVLCAAGFDVRVKAVSSQPVGTGQMAHNERIHIEYEGAASGAPATLVGKFPALSEESRASGARGAYRAETLFYTELAATLPVRTPACYYGAISSDDSTFTLLLEDLAPAEQGDQIAGAGDVEIEAAVRNLAGLHAPHWDDPALAKIDWMSGGISDEYASYIEMVTPAFLERYRDRLAPEDAETLAGFAAGVQRWMELRPACKTLVHGDYRLDNLMFETTDSGCTVSAVDWQTLSVACGGQDLAYLLGNSCAPEQRRGHEDRMLEAYRESMAILGVKLSAEEVRSDYLYGTFQGPSITMLGALAVGQTDRGDDMFMEMAHRSATQIRDLNALDLLSP